MAREKGQGERGRGGGLRVLQPCNDGIIGGRLDGAAARLIHGNRQAEDFGRPALIPPYDELHVECPQLQSWGCRPRASVSDQDLILIT